ncbi:MAG TPA: MATE family efflux transporter [Candidatus Blautia excrementipullorum]|nr:MATE family efflux transporter [Candidatus Blautia excrementipullorum]
MESKEKTMDLTTGHPLRQILIFSIPLVFGTIFQQLYSFADTVIVGRCLGSDALAAVGATSSLHFLILGFVQGACVGFGIPVAQSYGAKDRDEMCRYLWNGTWICLLISLFLSLGSVLLTDTLLAIMNTPEEIFFMARAYIVILFAGIPASVLYNYSASVMRAMGDSRHPFYFLLFSSVLNVILDYVLIAFFHMGVSGAAAATVFSQFVSGVLNVWWMFRRMDMIQGKKSQMKPSLPHIKRLCVVGLPMGFEYSVSAIGAVILQNSINTLGSGAVAAQTAGEKIRQMFTLPMESVGMAIATYAGQNFGAGKLKRIRQGIKQGMVIQLVYCVVIWAVLLGMNGLLVQIVLGEAQPEISAEAGRYLFIVSCLFIFHGSLMVFRNTLQGMGYSFHAIISGVWELAGRSLGGWLAVHGAGFTAVCLANPLAWIFALCYCIYMVRYFLRKNERKQNLT